MQNRGWQQDIEGILKKSFKGAFNKKLGQKLSPKLPENLTEKFAELTQVGEAFAKDIFDQLQTQKSKRMLDYALDVIRPHFLSLGLKVTRFHRLFCEIKVPAKARNIDSHGQIIESVMIGAGLEAFRLLWRRHLPEGNLAISFRTLNFVKHKNSRDDLLVRFELPELARESHLAELQKNKKSEQEATVYFFDQSEQRVAELQIIAELTFVEMLEWK